MALNRSVNKSYLSHFDELHLLHNLFPEQHTCTRAVIDMLYSKVVYAVVLLLVECQALALPDSKYPLSWGTNITALD